MKEDTKRKTIFCDIDGCILPHRGHGVTDLIREAQKDDSVEILPGVRERFDEWSEASYYIVITTARKECLRGLTERQLLNAGIHYDVLLMGVGNGPRILINDEKPDGTPAAIAFNLPRNEGLINVCI